MPRQRARKVDPELLHESVDGEWSFIETLRTWCLRPIAGSGGRSWAIRRRGTRSTCRGTRCLIPLGVPRDRGVRPSLDVVLELRRDRMATVRQVIDGLSDESLDGHTNAVEGPGWPEPRSYPVRECLLVVLNEEWEHRLVRRARPRCVEARSQPVVP